MRVRVFLTLVLLPAVALPAPAGILFGRKNRKPNPAQRVPELLSVIKTDKDEHKRARAAEELRNYDPAAYPAMIPVLVDALQHDRTPTVRAEAATTLSQLRPVSQDVGVALERARASDPSMRVRLQARSALLQYHWAGYRSQRGDMPPPNPGAAPNPGATPNPGTTREPPLAPDSFPPPVPTTPDPGSPAPRLIPQPTPQPVQVVPPAGGSELRKLPPGPPAPPRVPTTAEPPRLPEETPAPPPAPASPGGGPQLGPAL